MAKKKKTKRSGTSKNLDMLVVASKAKSALKQSGCNVASDALDGLNGIVSWYIQQASARAKANGRKTVRAHDFAVM